MKLLKYILPATLIAFSFSPQLFANEKSIDADLKNSEGKKIGNARLTQLEKGVKIEIQVSGLTPGEHAFHIHENGECKAPTFASAGAHYAPQKNKHGFDVSGGPHAGDMANLFVNADGNARIQVINTNVSLEKGKNPLLKAGGTSLVIHAQADDYKSQPAGNAGDRVACAEIKR